MQALYWKAPDAKECGALGLSVSDFPPPQVDLWPDNWEPLQFYRRNATQWRVGAAGPVGLDYNVFMHELDRRRLPDDEYEDMMGCIRVIESTVLDLQSRE